MALCILLHVLYYIMMNNLVCQFLHQGTVEFIMDKEQNFYFMEMNTRLQVRKANLLTLASGIKNKFLGKSEVVQIFVEEVKKF